MVLWRYLTYISSLLSAWMMELRLSQVVNCSCAGAMRSFKESQRVRKKGFSLIGQLILKAAASSGRSKVGIYLRCQNCTIVLVEDTCHVSGL